MTKASNENYRIGIESGNFDNDTQRIEYLLSIKPMTMKQVGKILGKDPRQFSSRFSKLNDEGKIEVIKSGKDSLYAIVENKDKKSLIERQRHQEKIEKWYKKGKELGIKFVTETPTLF